MCKALYAELLQNLPQTDGVKKRLQAMLIQRALIALHNAAMADKSQFEKDLQEITSDKQLIKAACAVGLVKNSRRAKIFSLMVIFRLKFLIRRFFWRKG